MPVLSAVGLLSAAVSGIDIEELLVRLLPTGGLHQYGAPKPGSYGGCLQHIAYRRGKNISVIMPYSDRLDCWRLITASSGPAWEKPRKAVASEDGSDTAS